MVDRNLQRICVYCGSSAGDKPSYLEAATGLARAMVKDHISLVYGGGNVGMMGFLANTVMAAGGEAIGVIPEALYRKEVAHTHLSELHVVGNMHERKAMMMELSDGFVALPGGLGTLEELFEVLTWAQLGLHQKPCGVLNVSGFFDPLIAFLDHVTAEGFINPIHRGMLIVEDKPERLLEHFIEYQPPVFDKAAWALGIAASRNSTQ